jgi:hypothetical protein
MDSVDGATTLATHAVREFAALDANLAHVADHGSSEVATS